MTAAPYRAAAIFPVPCAAFQYRKGGVIYLISGHFRILHKGHGDLLRHGALR